MKNMDPLNENIVQYLQASQDPFVCHIWKDGEQKISLNLTLFAQLAKLATVTTIFPVYIVSPNFRAW